MHTRITERFCQKCISRASRFELEVGLGCMRVCAKFHLRRCRQAHARRPALRRCEGTPPAAPPTSHRRWRLHRHGAEARVSWCCAPARTPAFRRLSLAPLRREEHAPSLRPHLTFSRPREALVIVPGARVRAASRRVAPGCRIVARPARARSRQCGIPIHSVCTKKQRRTPFRACVHARGIFSPKCLHGSCRWRRSCPLALALNFGG